MHCALPRARPADVMPPPRGTETVLIIEDDDMVRRLLERTLTGLGYVVLLAATGHEALAIERAHPGEIHLVLSDVVLPDISGPETVRRLLATAQHAPGILYMSGHTDHPLLRDGTLQGARNFIQKPLTRAEIAHKLREVLDAA
jgi:two-component system cell cycle sensor histidine kinase/response regulator CckA